MKRDRDPARRERRLSLNRETLRELTSRELGGVAGGTIVIVGVVHDDLKRDPDTLPRSNAWTGEQGEDGLCA